MPPLDPNAKDWLQAISWVAGAVAVVATVLKFWSEFKLTREQRKRELRWRQAEAGKSLNDAMMTDREASGALRMLDFDGRDLEIPSLGMVEVRHSDIRRSLDPSHDPSGPKDLHIRDCFDSLFYYLATLEHYIESTLILPEDVAFPLDYYIPLLASLQPQVEMYVRKLKLRRTEAFLLRYPEWRTSTPVIAG